MAGPLSGCVAFLSAFITGAAGAALLAKGGSEYLKQRRIAQTATSKALSAAVGLVEVKGMCAPAERLATHIGRRPCVFSRLSVEKFSQATKGWVRVYLSERLAPFSLTDAGGSLRVDPAGAAFHAAAGKNVHEVFLLKGGRPAMTQLEMVSELSRDSRQLSLPGQEHILGSPMEFASEPAVASILSSLPARDGRETSGLGSARAVARLLKAAEPLPAGLASSAPGAFRFVEESIPSGATVYVLGTAAADGGTIVVRKGRDGILMISDAPERDVSRARLRASALMALAGLALLSVSAALAILLVL